MIVGAVAGAVLGAAAGWAITQPRASRPSPGSGRQLTFRAAAPDYIRIGMSLLTVLRQVADLFKPAKQD